MALAQDSFGNKMQAFSPTENISGVTTLNVKEKGIIAILLPAAAAVKINGTGDEINWPAGVYGIHRDVNTLVFSVATTLLAMT